MEQMVVCCKYLNTIENKPSHFHDSHQLIYIKTGGACITINGEKNYAYSNSIVLISRYEEHSIEILGDTYERYDLRVSPFFNSICTKDQKLLLSVLVNRPKNFSHVVDMSQFAQKIESYFNEIRCELVNKSLFANDVASMLLFQTLICIIRTNLSNFVLESSPESIIIDNIKSDFEREPDKCYSISEISEKYHISASYLSHSFRQITGMSVMQYLTSCRIAAAKTMLANTKCSIKEIIYQCGFTDFSNFCRIFKKTTGTTPSDFRRNYKTSSEI